MCGDSSILVNLVVPHLERREVLLSTLADVAECFDHRPLLLLGCGDWYVRAIVEMRTQLESAFIIPYIGEDLLNRLTDKERFYALCAEVGVPTPRTVVEDLAYPQIAPAALQLPFPCRLSGHQTDRPFLPVKKYKKPTAGAFSEY